MNLLFVSPAFHPYKGGAESLVEDLSCFLVMRGHRVTILTGTPAPAPAGQERRGVPVVRVNFPRRGQGVFGRLSTLVRHGAMVWHHVGVIRRRRIETVCIGWFAMPAIYVLLSALFARFRLVIYLHGGETRHKGTKLFRWMLCYGLRRCDAVIAVSDDLSREAMALVPRIRHKLVVIPNGVDVLAVRGQAPAGPAERFFLFVGRLEHVKNVGFLLRAFARASRVVPDIHLVIAGTGSLDGDLKALARSLGIHDKVIFTGRLERETVYGLLKNAECVVHPSLTEGHPIILLEALAAGQWVLASNVHGNRDVIEHGRNGFLFDSNDEDQLVHHLVDVASNGNPSRVPGRTGAGFDLERFDLRRLVDKHLQVFRGVCS